MTKAKGGGVVRGCAYGQGRGKRREPHTGAVLNDGVASAAQVDVDATALVDADLARRHDDHGVLDACHVDGSIDAACHDQAPADVLERQPRERCRRRRCRRPALGRGGGRGRGGRGGHVDDAAVEACQTARRSRA